MIDAFLSEVRALFQHGRNIDIRYFKSLTEIGEKMEVENYESNQAQNFGSDTLLSLVAQCHDGHQTLLLEEEQKLQFSVHNWADEYLDEFRQKERERNRTRVLELNYFLDAMKREIDDLDVIPVNQFDDDA